MGLVKDLIGVKLGNIVTENWALTVILEDFAPDFAEPLNAQRQLAHIVEMIQHGTMSVF